MSTSAKKEPSSKSSISNIWVTKVIMQANSIWNSYGWIMRTHCTKSTSSLVVSKPWRDPRWRPSKLLLKPWAPWTIFRTCLWTDQFTDTHLESRFSYLGLTDAGDAYLGIAGVVSILGSNVGPILLILLVWHAGHAQQLFRLILGVLLLKARPQRLYLIFYFLHLIILSLTGFWGFGVLG